MGAIDQCVGKLNIAKMHHTDHDIKSGREELLLAGIVSGLERSGPARIPLSASRMAEASASFA